MLYLGLDEAGYGPNLGPLVVASTAYVGPDLPGDVDWWRILGHAVDRTGAEDRFIIDDSKRVLTRRNGRGHLARSVHAMLPPGLLTPADPLEKLFDVIAPGDRPALEREHWFEGNQGSEHPDASTDDADKLAGGLRSEGFSAGSPAARVLFPKSFNEQLDRLPTKADVELAMILELLNRQLDAMDSETERVEIVVDRLGGRRYYRSIVEELAGGSFVATRVESARQSQYQFERKDREVRITFRVKGDQESLPVAAASMIAKYVRERCMADFNRFWCRQVPSLRATAGYPVDARRFLSAIRPRWNELKLPVDCLWRKK